MRISTEEKAQLVTRYHNGESATDICAQEGISRSAFYTWLKPYQTTVTSAGHVVNAAEFVKMKKKLEKLEQKLEVLQKVSCMVSSPLQKNDKSTENWTKTCRTANMATDKKTDYKFMSQ